MESQNFDIVIIGAGISGIGTAVHLQKECPEKSYVILEGRSSMGGTWDLFRYPGIRSDSSMLTMAYSFKPWKSNQTTADGASILNYVKETAVEHNIEKHIRFNQHVSQAEWSSDSATWTITTKTGTQYSCNFLMLCAGYYSYKEGFTPEFKGRDTFEGTIVHPQKWPEYLDYSDKNIIVIGSGATAVTLVPELAKKAKHVVMLQRSPTYMAPMPNVDPFSERLHKILPNKLAYAIRRQRSIWFGHLFYQRTRKKPEKVKQVMIDAVKDMLPADYDVNTHFTPRYNPWDQRVCLVPEGDLFQAISEGTASVVTEHIEKFTKDGILLQSQEELKADIIVTATGLNLEVMGGINFAVDSKPVDFSETVTYKGLMFSGVPNLIYTFGYINASWTLGADLTAEYVCKLLKHMDQTGATQCTPTYSEDAPPASEPWIKDFSSGYMQRSMHLLPKQGSSAPWINTQNYRQDKKIIGRSPIEDESLQFR